MKYVAALMITTIFILTACAKPANQINWDVVDAELMRNGYSPNDHYEHASR